MRSIVDLSDSSSSRGVLARRSLVHWVELLEEWCMIHERYCRLVEEDAIYWSLERANISALAAAAWRCGWAALEEFPQSKRQRRSRFFGRADLFLQSPRSQDYVEAKFAWLSVKGTARGIDAFLKALLDALTDARNLDLPSGRARRIGVAFAAVYSPKGNQKAVSELLSSVFDRLQAADFDAAAWCFPPTARMLTWKDHHTTKVYPGVILLAKSAV